MSQIDVKSNEQENAARSKYIWFILLLISSILSLLGEFLDWVGNRSPWELFQLRDVYGNYYVYVFPLIAGILGLTISGVLFRLKSLNVIAKALPIVINLNLLLIFMFEAITLDGDYVWNYPSVYVMFCSLSLFLLGVTLYFYSIKQNGIQVKENQ